LIHFYKRGLKTDPPTSYRLRELDDINRFIVETNKTTQDTTLYTSFEHIAS